jgi:hypothetical protein
MKSLGYHSHMATNSFVGSLEDLIYGLFALLTVCVISYLFFGKDIRDCFHGVSVEENHGKEENIERETNQGSRPSP